jgi:hypothetical protein
MNKRDVWLVAGLLAFAGGSACARLASSDEPPIYVVNGSLEFQTKTGWSWQLKTGQGYDHEPPSGSSASNSSDLGVKVYLKGSGTCSGGATASGAQVQLVYDEGSGQKVFTVTRPAGTRTQVAPPQDLSASGTVLSYSGAGYLKTVRVGSWACDGLTTGTLDKVAICATPGDAACK